MDIRKTSTFASLSEASYADFRLAIQPDGSFRDSDVINALIRIGTPDGEPDEPNKGFSHEQAVDFVHKWKIVDHQPDTLSGFSATLFERINEAGEIIVVYLTFFHCLKFSTTP